MTEPTFAKSLELVRERWPLTRLEVVSWHQTVSSRAVAHVTTTQGEFAVKVDAQPHPSVVGGERVQAHVARFRPALAAEPVPSLTGALAETAGGLRCTVTRWVDGRSPGDDPESWRQVGAALADLHTLPLAQRPFAVPVEAACQELAAHPDWPTRVVGEVIRRVRGMEQQPSAIVHGQPSPANVIQGPAGAVTLLDWDESGTGPAVLDLGYPLICVFLSQPTEWHLDRARTFFRGYRDNSRTDLPTVDDIFAAALLHGLRSAMFADTLARLHRVEYALAAEQELIRALAP